MGGKSDIRHRGDVRLLAVKEDFSGSKVALYW